MKAISLWQPWAQLLVLGEKRFETRHWYTPHRGPLLIHAAKKADREVRWACQLPEIAEALAKYKLDFFSLPYGSLIGRVDLIGCCQTQRVPDLTDREKAFGDWSYGRFAWQVAHPYLLPEPIPLKGVQGFFTVSDELIQEATQA